jgi:hypothetical protein
VVCALLCGCGKNEEMQNVLEESFSFFRWAVLFFMMAAVSSPIDRRHAFYLEFRFFVTFIFFICY